MLGGYLVSVNMERLLSSSFRNGVLFLAGGGEGKAFKCLKEAPAGSHKKDFAS